VDTLEETVAQLKSTLQEQTSLIEKISAEMAAVKRN